MGAATEGASLPGVSGKDNQPHTNKWMWLDVAVKLSVDVHAKAGAQPPSAAMCT